MLPERKKDYPKLLKRLKKEVWEECKRIIKLRFGDVSYTSGELLVGSNRHTGHLFPMAYCGFRMKYDLRILRPQSYHENINLGGLGSIFFYKMVKEFGLCYAINLVDEVERSREEEWTIEKKILFLQNLLEEYRKL